MNELKTKEISSVRSDNAQWRRAMHDCVHSFLHWRIFCLIGGNEIRKRYSRSRLGQMWLTISLAVNISVMGFVWATLFKIPIRDYLPNVAAGFTVWTYISSCLMEGSPLYVQYASYLRELNMPKLAYCNALFMRNIIILLHNIPVLIVVSLIFQVKLTLGGCLLSVLGLVATTLFLHPIIVILSIIGLRFRDVTNIVASLIPVAMYVTPVIWRMESMSPHAQKIILYNPLTYFMALCKNPFFNEEVPAFYWYRALTMIVLLWTLAAVIFTKFRSRITYWL